ncbi:phosphatase domain-containing protein [Streptomyces sp. NPDC054796]
MRGKGSRARDGEARALAVFDLDGTLSDTRHRLHFVKGPKRDWNAFFRAALDDAPLPAGIALAQEWARECDLGYVTGRPERCRRDTVRWLEAQGLPTGELWMRDNADRRPARVAKPALLRRLAAERTVAVVVDDDVRVCEAYRAEGFHVIEADWMADSPTLEAAQEESGRT